ncbi:LuxR C-terminal-related transcriptional regulator [Microbacterium betulae]|uniref:LuxR C-terminal-related transcriptional regulator n=1 Tax=Microbacterium betulae TaxID=2981139 RepID=A0AA97FJ38_9MICO|nr:LuxR C-terminal-related transcriptional regulator [Microbacterium sp. AB]WOF23893.1 LuxR C-terminal-related transcriptional regulator [Microbacterium sp. AB]
MQATTQTRPGDEQRLIARAVDDLARRTRFPVAFGGLFRGGRVTMTAFHGTRTTALEGLAVKPERGLGGRAFTELRPRMANDYRTAQQITHDYDRYILGEGIGTLLAVPVVVDGAARGVLYGASWGQWGIGGVAATPAVQVAEELAAGLRARDEQDRERETIRQEDVSPALTPAHQEELRESYAELRRIAASVDDAAIRSRLEDVERRLAVLSGISHADSGGATTTDVRLSPRETDVLACAALGATNAEIAAQLGLREGTVKAYLGAAMSKLDASTRLAAVAKARRAGILP